MMWHWFLLMKFINLTNECLNHFFVISNMAICKSIVKFVVSLITLIAQPLKKNIYIYIYIERERQRERERERENHAKGCP